MVPFVRNKSKPKLKLAEQMVAASKKLARNGEDEGEIKNTPIKSGDSDSGQETVSSSCSFDEVHSAEKVTNNTEDEFEDAADEFCATTTDESGTNAGETNNNNGHKTQRHSMDFKQTLEETADILHMALNNRFVAALKLCQDRADKELYSSLACATLSFLRAALTLEPGDVQSALEAIQGCYDLSSKLRKKTSTASMWMRLIYKPDYNQYTDEECHAELVHAESLLLLALISFLSDQSIICLVKGAWRLRACYQRYKECLNIMELRCSGWGSALVRVHFESGVRMGYGAFNLLMSYLPRRVLRLLEYVGFSGDRQLGEDSLDKSVALNDGLRSVFAALIILTYNGYVENMFGLGNYNAEKVGQLNAKLGEKFPNSAFFLIFRGRHHQMQGQLEEAIETFERAIEAQDDWVQFHSICHWEIMWCYACQMNWPKAAHYSNLMRLQSKWSVASYTYQYATFLYAQLVEDERQGLCKRQSKEFEERMSEIVEKMKTVPELRVRYGGKTIPAEKFAITRSVKFFQQNHELTLPALEFLYIWNIFVTLKNNPKQTELLLGRIDSEIEHIKKLLEQEAQVSSETLPKTIDRNTEKEQEEEEKAKDTSGEEEDDDDGDEQVQPSRHVDDLSLALLLKAICLKNLRQFKDSEECLMGVLDNESTILNDTFLVPHSAMELALLKVTEHQYGAAKKWIKRVRNQYSGYLHEAIVHFRLHAAARLIRLEAQDSELTSSVESQTSANSDQTQPVEVTA